MSSFLIKKVNKIILNLMMTSNNLAKKLQVEPKDKTKATTGLGVGTVTHLWVANASTCTWSGECLLYIHNNLLWFWCRQIGMFMMIKIWVQSVPISNLWYSFTFGVSLPFVLHIEQWPPTYCTIFFIHCQFHFLSVHACNSLQFLESAKLVIVTSSKFKTSLFCPSLHMLSLLKVQVFFSHLQFHLPRISLL